LDGQAGIAGESFLSALVERTVQQVLEAEMTCFLGAESYERNGERRGWRNGFKPRTLKTRVGQLELMVPKDRDSQFQTELFERYQRSEKVLIAALMQMYIEGVSTRKVRAITEALCGLEISKSQVSALTQKLCAEIDLWRTRLLTEAYPYLIFDARYEKVRRDGAVVSQGVQVAIGISAAGYREVLCCWVAESESEASWSAVFNGLKQRGLHGVSYVVSDDHAGMVRAIERHFQVAVWQRCQVHFVRNALTV
jgi:transposase-like protein